MTAQISDIYRYKGEEYSITALTDFIPFSPRQYGLEPQSCCTACWKGYFCAFDIRDDGIYLHNLFIYNGEGKYPDLNGVSADPPEKGFWGHRRYSNVNLLIPYTGGILGGREFIDDYYIHMGFQMPFAYKILKEFVFEKGKLINIIDHSDEAAKMRERINPYKRDWDLMGKSVGEFVNDSFDLTYKGRWFVPEDY